MLAGTAAMYFLVSSQTSAVAAILITLLIILYTSLLVSRNLLRKYTSKKKRGAPEAGGAWPVIGHLHILGGPEPLHRVLGSMADKYGPIFTIKIGINRALVVSSWEMAKECLTTNDKIFASRPKTLAMEILGYNFSMFGSSPYGSYWRETRKIATLELLSKHRLEKLRHVRDYEVKTCLKELYELWDKSKSTNKMLVEMKRWFEDTIYALPFLRWLDIGGDERSMKKTAKELDIVVQGCLEEHKRKRDSREMKGEELDFMSVMLSILGDTEKYSGRDVDTINKAVCLGLIIAGLDTTTVTLTWVISLLLNHRDILDKVQNELDIQVGTKRQVNESDLKNLVYLQATLKEAMRLYPAVPLLIPHEAIEECTVNGYHVPAGTQLLINVWKLQRDPRVWEEPCKFQPERFLTKHKDIDVRGQHLELLPFGSGRRMCPGVSFALQVMQFTIASLLQGFDFATPSNEPLDMGEGFGLTMEKSRPLEVLIAPRLSASLYG
ncbi:Xanthotoxin 5-hydroxylase CYP82C4 [Citrus sinensis]|uniref:Xanthotoxin 5-hydroxylase CYP82C4 n=1 Tax=Citrus sinensis TaxID=2711 RepID=A0ACB8KG33_CITSI|nr:Xanthotoxin 5-hydroxylase CYP82C4 [Citrus sinensis]